MSGVDYQNWNVQDHERYVVGDENTPQTAKKAGFLTKWFGKGVDKYSAENKAAVESFRSSIDAHLGRSTKYSGINNLASDSLDGLKNDSGNWRRLSSKSVKAVRTKVSTLKGGIDDGIQDARNNNKKMDNFSFARFKQWAGHQPNNQYGPLLQNLGQYGEYKTQVNHQKLRQSLAAAVSAYVRTEGQNIREDEEPQPIRQQQQAHQVDNNEPNANVDQINELRAVEDPHAGLRGEIGEFMQKSHPEIGSYTANGSKNKNDEIQNFSQQKLEFDDLLSRAKENPDQLGNEIEQLEALKSGYDYEDGRRKLRTEVQQFIRGTHPKSGTKNSLIMVKQSGQDSLLRADEKKAKELQQKIKNHKALRSAYSGQLKDIADGARFERLRRAGLHQQRSTFSATRKAFSKLSDSNKTTNLGKLPKLDFDSHRETNLAQQYLLDGNVAQQHKDLARSYEHLRQAASRLPDPGAKQVPWDIDQRLDDYSRAFHEFERVGLNHAKNQVSPDQFERKYQSQVNDTFNAALGKLPRPDAARGAFKDKPIALPVRPNQVWQQNLATGKTGQKINLLEEAHGTPVFGRSGTWGTSTSTKDAASPVKPDALRLRHQDAQHTLHGRTKSVPSSDPLVRYDGKNFINTGVGRGEFENLQQLAKDDKAIPDESALQTASKIIHLGQGNINDYKSIQTSEQKRLYVRLAVEAAHNRLGTRDVQLMAQDIGTGQLSRGSKKTTWGVDDSMFFKTMLDVAEAGGGPSAASLYHARHRGVSTGLRSNPMLAHNTAEKILRDLQPNANGKNSPYYVAAPERTVVDSWQ